jgi:hypothetical protein
MPVPLKRAALAKPPRFRNPDAVQSPNAYNQTVAQPFFTDSM